MVEGTFGTFYDAVQTGSELVPIRITIPLEDFTKNLEIMKRYRPGSDRFSHLGQYRIPTNIHWEEFVKEAILPCTKYATRLIVHKVEDISVCNENVSLDCLLEDPDWDH